MRDTNLASFSHEIHILIFISQLKYDKFVNLIILFNVNVIESIKI
jgi:hypothetical protein